MDNESEEQMMIGRLMNKVVDVMQNQLMRFKAKEADRKYQNKIRASYTKLTKKKPLSKEQCKEIQDFYVSTIGHTVPIDWHQYFYSRTGVFSKKYIPTSEYKNNIIGRLNIYPFHLAYNDKNMTEVTLPHTPQPRIIVKNMSGYYYSGGKAITREEAIDVSRNLGEVIIKPSLTGRGIGVRKVCLHNGLVDNGDMTVRDLFDEYKADFLVQEVVRQHSDMAALNPSSINTIRFVSYRSGMTVNVVYSVIRIGRKGMCVDNESAGGISAVINPDGTIGKYAYGAPGVDMVEYTDSGVQLDGYKVPSFGKAAELVKSSHMQLPYFNLIGWDIAIREDGSPVMIELNLNPDLSQSANGPAFGEYTEEILRDAMSRKSTWTPLTTRLMNKRNYHKDVQ